MSCLLRYDAVDSGYGRARILHGVSLEVNEGRAVAVLGRNGVGKTTLVNTLLGLARLTRGRISIGNKPVNRPRPYTAARAGVAVVIQGRGILPNLTVGENLMLGAATRRPGPWKIKKVFDLFPVLKERAATPGTALSGGEQQMLAIGRILRTGARMLLLDEPTEGLAPVIVQQIGRTIARLKSEGFTILLVEQNFRFAATVADRHYVMENGKVVDMIPNAQLDANMDKLHAYLGV
jgi:branched-chain amino acid transport system ATP-binding protein